MRSKLIAVVASLMLLAWPGSFGNIHPVVAEELPLIEAEDVQDLGQLRVIVVTGVSARRVLHRYGSHVIVDTEHKVLYVLVEDIEA